MPTKRFCVDFTNFKAVWSQSQNFIFFEEMTRKSLKGVDCAGDKSHCSSRMCHGSLLAQMYFNKKVMSYIYVSGDPRNIRELVWLLASAQQSTPFKDFLFVLYLSLWSTSEIAGIHDTSHLWATVAFGLCGVCI